MSEKILVVGDMHIGARSASPIVMEHQLKYMENVLFPLIEKHNIKQILQLGDLFDTRKFSNHLILHTWKKRFFKVLRDLNVEFITLLGNHDTFYKNTNEVNTTSLFLSEFDNIVVIDKPTEMKLAKTNFLLLPWICSENREEVLKAIEKSTSLYCAGHLEFSGFEMHPGQIASSGEDVSLFEKFDTVFSGHYHTKSHKGNIFYTGIPYELTWIDYNDSKGIFIFDTDKLELEYVKNENPLFVKVVYNDDEKKDDYWKYIDLSKVSNSYVKLIVTKKTNP